MKSQIAKMVLSLTTIACCMGAMLAFVHSLTAAPIARAQADARNLAIAEVLPPYDSDPTADAYTVMLPGENRTVTLYPVSLSGVPAGTAVESWSTDGFSGDISVMVGFDASGAVSGYRVLSHAETPGLGAKADSWFRDPTGHRSIIGTTTPLIVSKDAAPSTADAGSDASIKHHDREYAIDGITAATITSRAFLDAVNRARTAITLPKTETK